MRKYILIILFIMQLNTLLCCQDSTIFTPHKKLISEFVDFILVETNEKSLFNYDNYFDRYNELEEYYRLKTCENEGINSDTCDKLIGKAFKETKQTSLVLQKISNYFNQTRKIDSESIISSIDYITCYGVIYFYKVNIKNKNNDPIILYFMISYFGGDDFKIVDIYDESYKSIIIYRNIENLYKENLIDNEK